MTKSTKKAGVENVRDFAMVIRPSLSELDGGLSLATKITQHVDRVDPQGNSTENNHIKNPTMEPSI